MTCKKCEYDTKLDRNLISPKTKEEIEYARLWHEIELPKLLKGEREA